MQPPAKGWMRLEQLAAAPIVANGPLGRAWRFVSRDVWLAELARFGALRRGAYRACRIGFLTLRSFVGDGCMIRAAALTYTTVLSLVPMLAFSFALLKGLGVYEELRHKYIDRYLDQLFGSLAPAAPPIAFDAPSPLLSEPGAPQGMPQLRDGVEQVFNLVDRTDLKGLGFIGLFVLVLAALRLLSSVENSFNEIWGVRKARSWVRKLSDYLTIVVVAPMLLIVAIGVTTAAQNAGVLEFLEQRLALGLVIKGLMKVAPVLIGWGAFTLVYLVMPNRRTKLASAALGGLVAGLAWQAALLAHIRFQIGVANYNAIYAGFAALPIFLVWVQLSWLIVLFGAELAFAHESEHEYRGLAAQAQRSQSFRERLALRVLTRVCDSFLAGERPRTTVSIAAGLGLAAREVQEVLDELVRGHLVAQADSGDGPGYLPARDPGRITVHDVLCALRGEVAEGDIAAESELDWTLDRVMTMFGEEARTSAHNRTLRELVDESRRRALRQDGAAAQVEPRVQAS